MYVGRYVSIHPQTKTAKKKSKRQKDKKTGLFGKSPNQGARKAIGTLVHMIAYLSHSATSLGLGRTIS
jgi:hypothetical protein